MEVSLLIYFSIQIDLFSLKESKYDISVYLLYWVINYHLNKSLKFKFHFNKLKILDEMILDEMSLAEMILDEMNGNPS